MCDFEGCKKMIMSIIDNQSSATTRWKPFWLLLERLLYCQVSLRVNLRFAFYHKLLITRWFEYEKFWRLVKILVTVLDPEIARIGRVGLNIILRVNRSLRQLLKTFRCELINTQNLRNITLCIFELMHKHRNKNSWWNQLDLTWKKGEQVTHLRSTRGSSTGASVRLGCCCRDVTSTTPFIIWFSII